MIDLPPSHTRPVDTSNLIRDWHFRCARQQGRINRIDAHGKGGRVLHFARFVSKARAKIHIELKCESACN